MKLWNKDFTLLLTGQITTLLGAGLLRFILSLYVLDRTGRADVYATLYAISNIPLLLAPVGGALADRLDRRRMMATIDFINGLVTLVFALLLLTGYPSIVAIGTVMVLLAIMSAMESPLSLACIPSLVPRGRTEQANGVISGVGSLALIVAPILGGALYGICSMKTLILFSCAAFFFASFIESRIQMPPHMPRIRTVGIVLTIANDIREGFGYVAKKPFIRKSIILVALINLVLAPLFLVGAPVILRVTMHSTDQMYGAGMSLISVASVLGALTVGGMIKMLRMKTLHRWLFATALFLLPVALSVTPVILRLGFYPSFISFMAGAVPISMIMTFLSIFIISHVQKETPSEILGKVTAIVLAVAQCAAPVGQILFGEVFEVFESRVWAPVLLICAAVIALSVFTRRSMLIRKRWG